jgi:predicted HicB family RNase H-like nuclease
MNILRREGYVAKIEFDGRDEILVGTVLGIDDVIGFHGHNVDMLKLAFGIAIREYRQTCGVLKRKPQRSHSGKVLLRILPAVHARGVMAAELRGMSLNGWIEEAMRRAAKVDLGER